jgi:acetolactate synthase-1/2/3 large subunit
VKTLKVSDYIAEFLHAQEIDHVFEMAGGMITHILDSIYRYGQINILSIHHEQSAAFAADCYGRCTGKPGIALATSGPGATNLLTGIASCYFDSSPAIFITGQVNLHEQKGDRNIRQLGFQETDIVAMAESVTKKCFRVTSADDIAATFISAYEIAISGRPGPVLIDLPMNLQRAEITVATPTKVEKVATIDVVSHKQLEDLYQAIQTANKPLILAGGGINASRTTQEFLQFVQLTQVPVITSLLGLDAIAFDHPLRVGFIGSYGNRWANLSIGDADLIIVIGSRLDIRQTGADVISFAKDKTIIHIDCETAEINNRVKDSIPIVADLQDFFKAANTYFATQSFKKFDPWLHDLAALKNTWQDINELKNINGINPNILMHTLAQHSKASRGFIADVGNHQMWAAQSLELAKGQFFITSGGMGAMGFALPAALGACLANAKQPVVVIVGDGSFQLNIQELETIVQAKLPIKIVVLNNKSLGMIRQFQDSYFAGRYQSTYWGYSAPNFELIATAYGIASKTISTMAELTAGLSWLWEDKNSAALLQVMIDPHVNVYPKIAFGKPITEMEPFFTPNEMEGT